MIVVLSQISLETRTLSSRGQPKRGWSWTSGFDRRPVNTDLRKVANYVLHKVWGLDGLLEWPSPAKQRRRESDHSLLSASLRPTEVIESVFHLFLTFTLKIKW